jgi:hypothetical protein
MTGIDLPNGGRPYKSKYDFVDSKSVIKARLSDKYAEFVDGNGNSIRRINFSTTGERDTCILSDHGNYFQRVVGGTKEVITGRDGTETEYPLDWERQGIIAINDLDGTIAIGTASGDDLSEKATFYKGHKKILESNLQFQRSAHIAPAILKALFLQNGQLLIVYRDPSEIYLINPARGTITSRDFDAVWLNQIALSKDEKDLAIELVSHFEGRNERAKVEDLDLGTLREKWETFFLHSVGFDISDDSSCLVVYDGWAKAVEKFGIDGKKESSSIADFGWAGPVVFRRPGGKFWIGANESSKSNPMGPTHIGWYDSQKNLIVEKNLGLRAQVSSSAGHLLVKVNSSRNYELSNDF